MMQRLAQATVLPNNGASNAQDFQPMTRNPQSPVNTQQQDSALQSPTSQDILSNSNAKIIVPTNDTQVAGAQITVPTQTATPKGINWFMVFVVVVVLGCGLAYFMRKKRRRKLPLQIKTAPVEPQEVVVVPEEEPVESPEASHKKPKSVLSTPPAKKPKKSKSKRKKSRK